MILTTLLLQNSIQPEYDLITDLVFGLRLERFKSNSTILLLINKKKGKISLYVCILFIQHNRQERDDLPTMKFEALLTVYD